jgi:hypothetical protein
MSRIAHRLDASTNLWWALIVATISFTVVSSLRLPAKASWSSGVHARSMTRAMPASCSGAGGRDRWRVHDRSRFEASERRCWSRFRWGSSPPAARQRLSPSQAPTATPEELPRLFLDRAPRMCNSPAGSVRGFPTSRQSAPTRCGNWAMIIWLRYNRLRRRSTATFALCT